MKSAERYAEACRTGAARRDARHQRGTTLALVSLLLFCLAIILLFTARAQMDALSLGSADAQARALHSAAQTGLETALAQADVLLRETAPIFDADGWTAIDGPAAQLDGGIAYRTAIRNHGLLPSSLTLVEIEARAEDDSGGARRVRQQARLRPWLANPPPAPLVVRGDIDLGGAVTLASEAGEAVLAWSGGAFHAPGAILDAATTRCPPAGVCEFDARLAGLGGDGLFTQLYARDPAALRALSGGSVLWMQSGAGPVVLEDAIYGSEDAPVLIIAAGDLEVRGAIEVDGMLHVTGDWLPGSGELTVRGALVVGGNAAHAGAASLHYAPDRLARLAATGVYARIAGSWADW